MTDDTPRGGGRSASDKDRARQQSRGVSSKAPAKSAPNRSGRQPAKGGQAQNGRKGTARPGNAGQSRAASPKSGPTRSAARSARSDRPANRPVRRPAGPRRAPTSLLTWGVVGLVLIVVIVLVVVKVTGGNSSNGSSGPPSQPVPATISNQVTHIPTSVYNQVGITSPNVPVTPPTIISGQPPLTLTGKPGVFGLFGEYCPYCAAERWSIVSSMSRFGTVSGLGTMQSSSTDVFPNTQTFTFSKLKYASPYLTFDAKEVYSNQLNSAGTGYQILQPLSKSEQALVNKYDTTNFLGTSTQSGSIPFMNIGNKALTSGASFSPSILANLTRSQIAADLTDPKNPVTQAIVASSNYISASICAIDGQQPAAVCTSSGVAAATKALKLG